MSDTTVARARSTALSLTMVRVPLDAVGSETFLAATLDDGPGDTAFDLEIVLRERAPAYSA